VERARKDYGVVVKVVDEEILDYRIDMGATEKERDDIRENRIAWMREAPESVKEKLAAGEIDEPTLPKRSDLKSPLSKLIFRSGGVNHLSRKANDGKQ
jgi:hypothetical protein